MNNQSSFNNQSSSNKNQINDSIGCIVTECEYHANSKNYCTLNHIDVVKHEPSAKTVECTDCGSFKRQS
ncbi:MAG: DUF1540 domain-containing protein [Clostridiaceae bacterium]